MKIFLVVKARTLILGLVVCFALLLVLYSLNQAVGPVFAKKSKDVQFLGHKIDSQGSDLRLQVESLTKDLQQNSIDAQIDPINKAVVPELKGFAIDIEATVASILAKRKGGTVAPVWFETEPDKTIRDYLLLPIYQGNPVKNQISLVVNVSWGNEYLEEILTILTEMNSKASFFLVGSWAEANPELVKRIHDLGMDFGNHGYSDPHMKDLDDKAIKEEINKTNQVIENITGTKVRWFSPPYGEKVDKIYAVAADLGLHTILWSLDTIDWKLPGEEVIIARIVENLHNGAIILMHPTEQTPGALPAIIKAIKDKGLDIVTITEMLNPSYWPQKYCPLWSEP